MSDFDFSEFQLDTLTIYGTPLTAQSNMSLAAAVGEPTVKHADWACSLQSATAAQSVGSESTTEFGLKEVISTYVAYGSEVLDGLAVGDWAEDGDGKEYEIVRWDNFGGTNPVGTVFAIYMLARGG